MKKLILFYLLMVLTACSSLQRHDGGPRPGTIDVSSIPDAVPRVEPRSKYGNPKSYVVLGKRYYVMDSSRGFIQRGIASWYGNKFHGQRTSSGEKYNMYSMTAAHKTLPIPTYLEVKNLRNGRKVIVRVNDRGPFHDNRIVDLSYTAAEKLGIVSQGTGLVEIRSLDPRGYREENTPVQADDIDRTRSAFYIQVGAFSSILNAQKLRKKLGALGTAILINKAIIESREIYRVWIGPIQDIELADRIVASLNHYGVHEHHIVMD